MGTEFTCWHLPCRRDVSCSEVNAVSRPLAGLEGRFRLSGEAAPLVAAALPRDLGVSVG